MKLIIRGRMIILTIFLAALATALTMRFKDKRRKK